MSERNGERSGRGAIIRVIREPGHTVLTARKREVCWQFGIPAHEPARALIDGLKVELRPGSILLVTGPSGGGKSSVLAALAEQVGDCLWVGRHRFDPRRSVIDAVAPRRPLSEAMEILTACGLGEPRLWLRSYRDLSEGEQFRANLARAVGEAVGRSPEAWGLRLEEGSGQARSHSLTDESVGCCGNPSAAEGGRYRRVVTCDEFTSGLHRRLAKAIAYNLRRLVSRLGLIFVGATSHEDISEDLRPDQVLRVGEGRCEVTPVDAGERPVSLRRDALITPGGLRDYERFASMHYRRGDHPGFVDKVFLLKGGPAPDPIGIAVYAHASMELAARNAATAGRFSGNLPRLNRELRVLRRLVMHPDVRGCGLGHWFVRRTLPRVGVRFVECLASMGGVNPVFERAGMTRVGPCPLPRGRMRLVERLQAMKLDPFAPGFESELSRAPRVRMLVEETIAEWSQHTHGGLRFRVSGRSGEDLSAIFRQIIGRPPVYYLWDREGEFPRSTGPEARRCKTDPRSDGREARRPGYVERSPERGDRYRPEEE